MFSRKTLLTASSFEDSICMGGSSMAWSVVKRDKMEKLSSFFIVITFLVDYCFFADGNFVGILASLVERVF
jgi:hypothetical protein